jgi:hypothetical protein
MIAASTTVLMAIGGSSLKSDPLYKLPFIIGALLLVFRYVGRKKVAPTPKREPRKRQAPPTDGAQASPGTKAPSKPEDSDRPPDDDLPGFGIGTVSGRPPERRR